MQIRKCDRCGKVFDTKDSENITIWVKKERFISPGFIRENLDLCFACRRSWYDWFNKPKDEKEGDGDV